MENKLQEKKARLTNKRNLLIGDLEQTETRLLLMQNLKVSRGRTSKRGPKAPFEASNEVLVGRSHESVSTRRRQ